MLDAIYKEIANKELTMWCRIKPLYSFKDEGIQPILGEKRNYIENDSFEVVLLSKKAWHWELERLKSDIQIMGHPVMIWDVLDWVNKNIEKSFIEENPVMYDWLDEYRQEVLYKRTKPKESIEEQSERCIAYIYSLLPTNTDDTTK